MKRFLAVLMVLVVGVVGSAFGVGIDQGNVSKGGVSVPSGGPSAPTEPTTPGGSGATSGATGAAAVGAVDDRKEFEAGLDLARFRLLAIQSADQVKIVDSWARQTLEMMHHSQSIDGQDPVYTALDIAFRPTAWANRNILYVHAIPIREELVDLAKKMGGSAEEGDRILHTGMVSYAFLNDAQTQDLLARMGQDVRKADEVAKVETAHDLFIGLGATLFMVPPPAGAAHQLEPWRHVMDLLGNVSDVQGAEVEFGLKTPMPKVEGYTSAQADAIRTALENLLIGWDRGNVGMVNKGLNGFAEVLPAIDPVGYRSEAKRVTELWYNRTFYGTILNVFLYFISLTLFLMVAVGVTKKLETPALWVFGVAVATHVAAMGVRWWLAGRIPIQNEFESVLGSAMIGCVVGLMLELWKRKGIFGAAFSFVGFLAMTACFSCQYVFGKDIGGSIGRVKGILSTYWLYIHVNIVISSYALIAASFVIGAVYLAMKLWFWINPLEAGDDGERPADGPLTKGDRMVAKLAMGAVMGAAPMAGLGVLGLSPQSTTRLQLLEGLDQANMVILQMAFWFLGTGIMCGAVWADHSWGRPWGWDPKETFPLVTWIVYLVIVHLRFVTPGRTQKDWTAWLSVVGFAVMMFNWIGVNFWLVGLHSYA